MELPRAQRTHAFKPMSLLLLTIMLIIPLSSHATAYLYTYTSAPLTETKGTLIPPLPVIGDQLKIQFTLNTDQQQAWDSKPAHTLRNTCDNVVGPYTIVTPPDELWKDRMGWMSHGSLNLYHRRSPFGRMGHTTGRRPCRHALYSTDYNGLGLVRGGGPIRVRRRLFCHPIC